MAQIVVVEDNDLLREMWVSALRERGHTVHEFAKCGPAEDHLFKCPPDLLMTDVQLPDGNGLELVARVRDWFSDPFPVVVTSGLSQEFDVKRGFAAGATDYLTKPFGVDEMLAKFDAHLARYSTHGTRAMLKEMPGEESPAGLTFDRYEVEHVLGHGSYGTVYSAFDTQTRSEVALKVQHGSPVAEPEARLRFLREIYALSSVRHRNVVTVKDFGAREGRFYYAMEHVSGPTLHERVLEKGPTDPCDVIALIGGLTNALAALAQAKLVHRDLKPANIILREGRWDDPVLVDFGLAKREFDQGVTHSDLLVGTPAYMAPELMRGEDPSPRTDLFSLGIVALFALTKSGPFPKLTGLKLVEHMSHHPVSIPVGLPEPLATLLPQLTSIDPTGRPPSPGALLARFDLTPKPCSQAS